MEYKNIVLKYYWDQPIVQVLTFLRNKQLLSGVTFEGARRAGLLLCFGGIEVFDYSMQILRRF